MCLGIIFYLSSRPANTLPAMWFRNMDKILHGLEYGALSLLLFRAVFMPDFYHIPRTYLIRNILYIFLFCLIFAATDEIHQIYVPGRSADVRDWLFDAGGAVLALAYCWYCAGGGRHDRKGRWRTGKRVGKKYYSIIVVLICLFLFISSAGAEETASKTGLFQVGNLNVLVAMIIFSFLFILFLRAVRKGRTLHLRRIAGIDAIEEAVGRATEMGRPVMFVPGIDDLDEIQTLAGIAILGHVARVAARYDSSLIVPTCTPLVLTVCEETVRENFIAEGRPDVFRPDNIRYLSNDQFAFAAGVDGIILRERPAANIFMGAFYAESLILAETGFEAGCIQVSGTAIIPQLPFFIAACDYTLLAEEFYAASAYLSRDPKVLAGIKTSDWFKVFVIAVLIIGIIAANIYPGLLDVLKKWF